MDLRILIIIAVIALVGALFVAWSMSRKQRTDALRRRFGPEYDRTVHEFGAARAEAALLERKERVERFSIRELTADERGRFVTEWRNVQSRFVDAPHEAATEADKLVDRVMLARGYPVSDFEQPAADISVDHPAVVNNYRAAHEIALRHRRGEATTEDLRKAIIYYRSLFDDLLHAELIGHRREVA